MDRVPIFLWKSFNHWLKAVSELFQCRVIDFRLLGWSRQIEILGKTLRRPSILTKIVHNRIVRDFENPCWQPRLIFHSREISVNVEEDFLHHIFCIGGGVSRGGEQCAQTAM